MRAGSVHVKKIANNILDFITAHDKAPNLCHNKY